MADLATSRTSGYPAALDTQSAEEKDEGVAGATAARSQPVQACVDAIIKLQTELGVDPAGTYATVVARLVATDAGIPALVLEKKTAPAIAAGVVPLDCNAGNVFAISLTANITSFTMSNVPATGTAYGMSLEFTADGTLRTITWSFSGTTVKWAGGTAPTMTSTNAKKDIMIFYTHDAGANWYGAIMGQNF